MSMIAGGVEEVEQTAHEHAADQHGDGPEGPEEQCHRHVEGSEAQRPGVAAAVDRARHVRRELLPRLVAGRQAAEQEAGVRVQADGLHVADEGEHEAERDGQVLGCEHLAGLVPVHQPWRRVVGRGGGRGRDADEDADDGDERDGRGGQHRRRHDVVPQRLHRQHAVLLRVLRRHTQRVNWARQVMEIDQGGIRSGVVPTAIMAATQRLRAMALRPMTVRAGWRRMA